MSQGTLEAGERDQGAAAPLAHISPPGAPTVRNDLLPFMVLLGAFYGRAVAAAAVLVAAIVLLVH